MAPLRTAAFLLALCLAAPVHAETVATWQPHIGEASRRFGVPRAWIERVMRAESGGRTMREGRPVRSSAGAMGLMQLMPGTWAEMRVRLGLGPDPDQPRDNILAGTAYLRLMYDRFGYPGLFAAYNAGPERYAAYLAGRRSLPPETVAYVAAVAQGAGSDAPGEQEHSPLYALFAIRGGAPVGPSLDRGAPLAGSLFAPLSQGN